MSKINAKVNIADSEQVQSSLVCEKLKKTLPTLVKDTLKDYQSNQIHHMQESFAEITKKEETMQQ